VPAVEGWFTLDEGDPALLGTRCTTCGTVFFPREERWCRNPECDGAELTEVRLSTRGRVWSYTNACYQPPAPYVPRADPFEPFTLAAVELAEEQLVVLGQLVDGVGVEDLSVGTEVELVLDTLFEDDETETVVYKWRPV
jgi:uncharacterized protein